MRRGDRSVALAALRAAAGLAALGALLAGCAEVHRSAEAVERVGTPVATADDAVVPARSDVKIVRPRGTAAGDTPAFPVAEAAVPSPRDIFDFHPPGSRPDSWRQPFVIDTNDGPLAGDVRRSAAELRAFLAQEKSGAGDAKPGKRRCGEDEIARGVPGCPGAPARAAAAPAPDAQP